MISSLRPIGSAVLFTSNSQKGSDKKRAQKDNATESILMQPLKKVTMDIPTDSESPKTGPLQRHNSYASGYFSFPKVDGWSDYEDEPVSPAPPSTPEPEPANKTVISTEPQRWHFIRLLEAQLKWLFNIQTCRGSGPEENE